MSFEDIIKTYGKSDYMDINNPGRIYHLSKMEYHLFDDTTRIPVSEDGEIIGYVKVKGDYTK